ncbi:TPA: helix-turn-helix transcriptional regulator [Corynebacterium striatum]|uniref:helix-turn-helix domain-containing protein n=1 Tax=unclassified Corynebacterium TaxID=2624378 RepID=UPI0009F625B2|nr:helix-turn-helix transcriptional regulator [Corynebacterium striatum]
MTTSFDVGRVPEWTTADRARKARETAGMNQGQLAAAMGVARSTVQRIEQGVAEPRRPLLAAWALATGVPASWLENGKTPTGDNPGGGEGCAIRDLNPEPTD